VSERWTPVLDDFVDAASFILGAEPEAIRRLPGMALAESALHAPFASFGGVDAYPTLIGQAAVLLEHLARNHPRGGNKRVAFLLLARFLDANGVQWGPPDVDTDAGIVESVAVGDASHEQVIAWIQDRTASR
jgi:death on curing protein